MKEKKVAFDYALLCKSLKETGKTKEGLSIHMEP